MGKMFSQFLYELRVYLKHNSKKYLLKLGFYLIDWWRAKEREQASHERQHSDSLVKDNDR